MREHETDTVDRQGSLLMQILCPRDAVTDDEVHNFNLSSVIRPLSTELFYVHVRCSEINVVRTLQRASETEDTVGRK